MLSWIMCAWSLITMWLMSEKRYKTAWISSVASQFGWIYISATTELWGMAAYSTIMIGVGVRALYKLHYSTQDTK